MGRRKEYGCNNCGSKPKSVPYGAKRTKFWCFKCDRGHASEVNKKSVRSKTKKEIKDYIRLDLKREET